MAIKSARLCADETLEEETSASVTKTAQQNDRLWSAWMAAGQTGDKSAYETLLRDCIPFIKRIARALGVHANCIDDVVQETLFTVHAARQTYDPNRSFTAWLRTIAQRRAIDGLRRAGRTTAREIHAPLAYENHPDLSASPETAAFEVSRTAVLYAAIGALPARQRDAIEHLVFRRHDDASEAVIERTNGSLRVSWHRAIKSLRAHITEKA